MAEKITSMTITAIMARIMCMGDYLLVFVFSMMRLATVANPAISKALSALLFISFSQISTALSPMFFSVSFFIVSPLVCYEGLVYGAKANRD